MKFHRPIIQNGTRRIRRKFLWLPMRVGSHIHWLESVRVEEIYDSGPGSTDADFFPRGWYINRVEPLTKGKI